MLNHMKDSKTIKKKSSKKIVRNGKGSGTKTAVRVRSINKVTEERRLELQDKLLRLLLEYSDVPAIVFNNLKISVPSGYHLDLDPKTAFVILKNIFYFSLKQGGGKIKR